MQKKFKNLIFSMFMVVPMLLTSCRRDIQVSTSGTDPIKHSSEQERDSSSNHSSSRGDSSGQSSKKDPKEPHVHNFVEVKIKDATCTESALYIKKCECGETQGDAYHLGSPLGHDFSSSWMTDNAEYHYKKCKRANCSAIHKENHNHSGKVICDGDKNHHYETCSKCGRKMKSVDHVWQEDPQHRYKRSDATCEKKATYYKVCMCGAVSDSEYFEYGEKLPCQFEEQIVSEAYIKEGSEGNGSLVKSKTTYYKACKHCHKSAKGVDEKATFTTSDVMSVYFGNYPRSLAKDEEAAKLKSVECKGGIYYLNNDKFVKNAEKFYRIEPLKWNVYNVVVDDGEMKRYILITDEAVDNGPYMDKYDAKKEYHYSTSLLRCFLNTRFLSGAFDAYCDSDISEKLLVNTVKHKLESEYQHATTDTKSNDKVYALSQFEAYKNGGDFSSHKKVLQVNVTDYAKSYITGRYQGPIIWTRSACNKEFACTYSVAGGKFHESKSGSCNFASVMPVISVTEETFKSLKRA